MSVDSARQTGCAVLYHFRWAFIITALGPIFGAVVGWSVTGAMHGKHLSAVTFGGVLLMMVGLSFFFDKEKNDHWMRWIMYYTCGVFGVALGVRRSRPARGTRWTK